VVSAAAQYVISTAMSSGQHSLHARRLVASHHLSTATTWNWAVRNGSLAASNDDAVIAEVKDSRPAQS